MRKRTSVYRQPPVAWRQKDELLSYFNFGVVTDAQANHHPWKMLMREAQTEDFVVVKVDIDHPSTEEPLIRQLLGDDAVAALIDELYFEHHVKRHPLGRTHFGWAHSVSETNCTIMDSYEVFARLREKGIRAHSWV